MTPYEYGKSAFERGIKCAPALDREFLATRAGLPVGSHRDGAYDEWLRGWTEANLAAPVVTARPMTTAQPAVTKRIGRYDPDSHDFPAYVVFEDGHEEYIGSRPTQHDASLLASDYIIQFYQDSHTPEAAARLIHEELAQEGRHEELAAAMDGVWVTGECFEETGAPDQEELREWAEAPDTCAGCDGGGCPCCDPKLASEELPPWVLEAADRALERALDEAVARMSPTPTCVVCGAPATVDTAAGRLCGTHAPPCAFCQQPATALLPSLPEGFVCPPIPICGRCAAQFERATVPLVSEALRTLPSPIPYRPCDRCGQPFQSFTARTRCATCLAVACPVCQGPHHPQTCPAIRVLLWGQVPIPHCPSCGDPSNGLCAACRKAGEQPAGHMTCADCCRVGQCFHNNGAWICVDRGACWAHTQGGETEPNADTWSGYVART